LDPTVILRQAAFTCHFLPSVCASLAEDGNGPAPDNDEGAVTTTGCALAAAIFVSSAPATTADVRGRDLQPRAQDPTLTLNVQNVAKVAVAVVEEAKATLTWIYQAAGIRVHWNTAAADFTVIIRSPPHPRAVRDNTFALGFAPRTSTERGRLAFVLADRIQATSSTVGVPYHLVLGMTMAHEVAHLLLPYNTHSRSGIMRDDWTRSDYQKARLGQLLFTDDQARLMRDALVDEHQESP
jgi:hypothetical protein